MLLIMCMYSLHMCPAGNSSIWSGNGHSSWNLYPNHEEVSAIGLCNLSVASTPHAWSSRLFG